MLPQIRFVSLDEEAVIAETEGQDDSGSLTLPNCSGLKCPFWLKVPVASGPWGKPLHSSSLFRLGHSGEAMGSAAPACPPAEHGGSHARQKAGEQSSVAPAQDTQGVCQPSIPLHLCTEKPQETSICPFPLHDQESGSLSFSKMERALFFLTAVCNDG